MMNDDCRAWRAIQPLLPVADEYCTDLLCSVVLEYSSRVEVHGGVLPVVQVPDCG
jgi:hypothetical protein